MALFAKLAEKKKDAPKVTKRATVWFAGDPAGDQVAKAVDELVKLEADSKAIAAKMDLYKNVVKRYAEEHYLQDYVSLGVAPETPMVVQSASGCKVSLVVQDRSGQANISEAQQEMLAGLLGPEAAQELLYNELSFGFNRQILAIPGVQPLVEKTLEAVLLKLQEKKILSAEQAEELIEVKSKTALRPGTLDRLCDVCGRSVVKIKQFLDAVASASVRYIKV